jgi:hypothetical protein
MDANSVRAEMSRTFGLLSEIHHLILMIAHSLARQRDEAIS